MGVERARFRVAPVGGVPRGCELGGELHHGPPGVGKVSPNTAGRFGTPRRRYAPIPNRPAAGRGMRRRITVARRGVSNAWPYLWVDSLLRVDQFVPSLNVGGLHNGADVV